MTALNLVSLLLVAVMLPGTFARGGLPSCCRKTTDTKVDREQLTNYYIQQPPCCPLHAVVFITLKRKRICADNSSLWTQKSMAYLDRKNDLSRQQTLEVQ
ncbi:monocyte chemotactic protein 1B-like [Syngnathoides biaculeatus]|uniref:monocyte chemotactic protein 1B-like n=1 Tax=Syngnathoides biaculeatus TaxID=300417 RepID=UPI002ADD7FB6|nr:monocyte chemotactic protein 1B-like [Syngnathoides biaculeatus]